MSLIYPDKFIIKIYYLQKAVETGITIMTEKWVDAVWEESINQNIVSTEQQFDKYKCPPFYKLNITTSGLEGINREKIITLISENGKIILKFL